MELGNASQVCRELGISRSLFYRWKRKLAQFGPEGLHPPRRGCRRGRRAVGKNVRPGERIWVLPEINAVDVLFSAREVSPYPLHLPGWLDEEAEAELIRVVKKRPPDVVVIFSRSVNEYGVADCGRGYDRLLAEWVARNYLVVE